MLFFATAIDTLKITYVRVIFLVIILKYLVTGAIRVVMLWGVQIYVDTSVGALLSLNNNILITKALHLMREM